VISRIDYDNETDCLVGFVMPCDGNGVPLTTSFKADSYESMEAIFRNGEFAKYALVYMAQPLARGVPAFCLACLGTNNKFTSEHVLKRWQYIYTECKKLGIVVISFGADGDSLQSLPDAKGTIAYLYALRCVIDSYLDKSLKPLERVKKAWFSVFFTRYWRQWIMLSPNYFLIDTQKIVNQCSILTLVTWISVL